MRLILASGLAGLAALGGCATEPRPTNATGDYLAARLASRINAVDDAAAAFADAHRIAPGEVGILREAFFFHLAAGDIEAARPYAEKLMSVGGEVDDGLARLLVSAIALKAGDLKAARARISGPINAPFVKSAGFLTEAWIEAELAGPGAALAMLDNPGADIFTGFNPLHRALLADKAGRADEARAAFQTSVLSLGGPVARAAYGAFLERAGDQTAARDYYNLLAAEPGPARRVAMAGLARLDRGRVSQAYSDVSAAKGAAIAYYSFGGAMIEQAAAERARAEQAGFVVGEPRFNLPLALAQIALHLDPELDEARRLVAVIFSIYGDFDAAYGVLEKIPPTSPHYEQARIEMAGGRVSQGEPEKAAALLEDAIRRDPRGTELKWTLANVYASIERHEAAVKTLDAALRVDDGEAPSKDAWRYYISRGASLLELDRWPEAEADLKRAVDLAPEEPTALNYLGYSWAERGVNLDEAFGLIEKAVALQPDSGAIIDSLGWAHYQRGEYEEAVGHLEHAASLEPDDPTITDHLGDVYWRLGREVEAGFQWRRALELNPSDKLRGDLEKKLKDGLPGAGRGA